MNVQTLLRSSVLRKQIVAVTGLMMVGFIIMHLAGNLLIFLGPGAFNEYSHKLHSLGELLWVARLGLLTAVLLHIGFTVAIVMENRAARTSRYAVNASKQDGNPAWIRKYMILTGGIVFFFLFFHLNDFTFPSKTGERTIIAGAPEAGELELYGLVWNSFGNFFRVVFYVAAVTCVGMHLSHGVQSMFQTIGFNHERYTPLIRKASVALGAIVAVGFSLIPIYVLLRGTPSL